MKTPESFEQTPLVIELQRGLDILKKDGLNTMNDKADKAIHPLLEKCKYGIKMDDCLTTMIEVASENGWASFPEISIEKVNARLEEKLARGEIEKLKEVTFSGIHRNLRDSN